VSKPKPRNHKPDPAEVERTARELGTRVLALMLNGLQDEELCRKYDALRDALIGKPNFYHPSPKKKAPAPKGEGVSD
jgi:hypothetical protein